MLKIAHGGPCDHLNHGMATLALAPTVVLLSADETLKDLVVGIVEFPWTLSCHASAFTSPEVFARPNVRLVVLDDESVEENELGRLLTQIGRRAQTTPLIYVAVRHNHEKERQARASGAHYYTSKPISPAHFQYVLESFLRTQQ